MCWPSEPSRHAIAAIDPATYRRHELHGEERVWAETNCYTDVLIELAHGLGHDPVAMLPFTLAIDFEGDQWTFFKPLPSDLYRLYGFDVQELAVWRPLLDHVVEQLKAGHPVLVELDSHYLPDTNGTAYRIAHMKSTVGVNAIDAAARRLDYFHNASFHRLEGEDFDQVFQVSGAPHERVLPPYVEYVKWRRNFTAPRGSALVDASLEVLRDHAGRIPQANPFAAFKARFERDLEWLLGAELGRFHAYSFATLRQFGACYELAASYLRWLGARGITGLDASAEALQSIAADAKNVQFQLARSMARQRPLDLEPLDRMGTQWERAMTPITRRFA